MSGGLNARSWGRSTDQDWSAGPWEATCVTRLIRQRQTTDCGVACLAMTAGVSYERALEVFLQHGLDHRRKTAPLLSNFADLEKAARSLGLRIRRQRWTGWCRFSGVGVLKVKPYGTGGRKWHWVAAERHPQLGIVVRDPAFALTAIELAPEGVLHQALEHIRPCGSWLSVAADASSAQALPGLFRQ